MSSSPAFKEHKELKLPTQPPILSRLRPRNPRKRQLSLLLAPITLPRNRLSKKTRARRRNLSSPLLALSSLYYFIGDSKCIYINTSLYIFDEAFYTNNLSILN